MYLGIAILCIAYILSQFFRSFLAVLSSVLANDIGAQPDDLAYALGLLFFVFAVMQIPVGWGLDRFGPRIVSFVKITDEVGNGEKAESADNVDVPSVDHCSSIVPFHNLANIRNEIVSLDNVLLE